MTGWSSLRLEIWQCGFPVFGLRLRCEEDHWLDSWPRVVQTTMIASRWLSFLNVGVQHVRRERSRSKDWGERLSQSWWTSKFYLYSVELCDVFIKWYNKINWLGGSSQKLGIFPLARGKTTYGLFGQDAREQPAQTQCNRVEGVDCFNSVI